MKPDWLKVKQPCDDSNVSTLLGQNRLKTVCEEAACPNIGSCWKNNQAAFIVMGNTCTRGCRFCNIKTGIPSPLDENEPERIADAVAQMNLSHVVVTSVTRDDLPDGGAQHFINTIRQIRLKSPETTIEILTPDFRHKIHAVEAIVAEKPDVFNHNIETVSRLYNDIRLGANYYCSLKLLNHVKELDSNIITKSGIMVGLGETDHEIYNVMDDLIEAKVDFLTIGQYLAPSDNHCKVDRFVTPEQFAHYKKVAESKGFKMVSSSPLTRSSFHAAADFNKIKNRMLYNA